MYIKIKQLSTIWRTLSLRPWLAMLHPERGGSGVRYAPHWPATVWLSFILSAQSS